MASRARVHRSGRHIFSIAAVLLLLAVPGVAQATPEAGPTTPQPRFAAAAAFDVSPPLRELAQRPPQLRTPTELPPERGPMVGDRGFSGDGAIQEANSQQAAAQLSAPVVNFEGLANSDNPFLVSPPDPVGDVGPHHYVEMVNIVFAVYAKSGERLLGPLELGALWEGFAVPDCTDPSGDPIVLHDQFDDRWILTQFSTRGPTYYNCVAISQTGDPTGAYYRYAFSSGENFPDYPKYGVWTNSYLLTTREFAPDNSFAGVGIYALERARMLSGDPAARAVQFQLTPGSTPYLPGDGLLPADIDGARRPRENSPALLVGSMDDGHRYGAPFDGLNIFELAVAWRSQPTASFALAKQLPVASFDSVFPCSPGSRNCIPQPRTSNKVDILSYRQRPTWRLAYRNFGTYEALVTNQSVEARPGIAGVRWYELRRINNQISLYQQGTYAPDDGVHRWMGSVAMDRSGNIGLGYSVSNATTVFPGIRYTGRLRSDPPGQMAQGEAVLIDGSGSQLVSARWGDYTSMNVDPTDDCTFWYVNEYYQAPSPRGWQTRIGSFRLSGCS